MLAIAGYVALIMEKNTKKGFIMFFLLELFSFFVRYKAMLMIQPLGGITWLTLTLIQIAEFENKQHYDVHNYHHKNS